MDPTLVETRDEPVTAKVPVVEELKGYVTGNSHKHEGNNLCKTQWVTAYLFSLLGCAS